MTAPKKPPAHGTVQRYRLELRERRDGRGNGPCEKCRTANRARARAARANSVARDRRSRMTLVEPVTDSGHTDVSPSAPTAPGVMQQSVEQDISEIDEQLRVPFHRSLSALAIALAKEIDDTETTATARRDARKQLFEVLRSLRTQKEGDDGSALTVLLEQAGFGVPLVPGRPA